MKRFPKKSLPRHRRRPRRWWLCEPTRPSPAIHSWVLHRQTHEEALARTERHLGGVDDFKSKLIKFRWTDTSQVDWKAEIGHWLHTAEECGFLEQVVSVTRARTRKGSRPHELDPNKVDPNDRPHLVLRQELAPAKMTHYLVRTGWNFVAWEPIKGGSLDVDVRLRGPSGVEVDIQVKAPDQPGEIRNHRLVHGEYDERVITQISNAAGQLPADGTRPTMIAVTALRRWPLSVHPGCVVTHAMGPSINDGGVVSVWGSRAGAFFQPEWRHVSAVMLLDYMRSDVFTYSCTVLVNPNALRPIDPEWFPHSAVLILDHEKRFRWTRGEPAGPTWIRDGTAFDPNL